MKHKDVRWNGENEEWFCAKCGRTSDHIRKEDALVELEKFECVWFKILNREYSQKQGREELFERERHKEPVPGWHLCAIACAEAEVGV